MRVIVEEDLCEGHGLCVDIAPDLFRLRDDGLAEVILEAVPAGMEDAASQAVRRCPASAIALEA